MDGLPKSANKSKYDLDGGGGQVSLLIRLSHKVRQCEAYCFGHTHIIRLLQQAGS